MKYILALLLITSAFADNILTNYRLHGITNIEKQMDMELTKEEYWNSVVEKIDTKFGYIEAYINVLACDKSSSSLEFYSLDANNSFTFKKKHSAFLGKINGDKTKEGDLKTPIGIYQLTQKLSKETKLDSFYGPVAFVTSYPNIYDTYRGKNGSGIWIHGLPEQEARDEYTKGCIAIGNPNIECLNKNITIDKTVLIINDSKVKQDISKQTLASILSQLYAWRYAWIYDEIENYLSFYSHEFVRDDGMALEQFKSYKTRIFGKNERKSIIFTNINIIPYPNTPDIYYISFNESYRSDSFKFNGEKVLIVKYENKKIHIITEK